MMVSVRSTFTVSVRVAVRLAVLGLVPFTVIVVAPAVTVVVLAVAPAVAVIVRVVVQVGLHDGVENAAVTPAGSADRENVTAWVVPARSVAVTAVVPGAPPAVSATVLGLAANE